MEQPNMMQNGMQMQMHAQMNNMQRPQAGNMNQQIFAKVVNDIRNGMAQFAGGWQATFDPRERGGWVMQLITALRLLERDTQKCIAIAQRFEQTNAHTAQNKLQYEQSMKGKLEEIKQKRESSGQMMRFGNNMPNAMQPVPGMNAAMNMQQPQNLGGAQNMTNNAQPNQAFPSHLQRPMQPSPLRNQQLPRQPVSTLDPAMLNNQQMQQQSQLQQQQQQLGLGMQMNGNSTTNNLLQDMNPARPQQQQQQQQSEQAMEIHAIADRLMSSLTNPKKNELRQKLLTSMPERQRAQFAAKQIDPLKNWVINRAKIEYMNKHGVNPQPQNSQMNMNAGMGNANNIQTNNNLGNQQTGNFSLSQMYGQQANAAMKLQESGEQVVPVSSNNNSLNFSFGNLAGQDNLNQSNNNTLNLLDNTQQNKLQNNNGIPADTARQTNMLLQQQQEQQQQKQMQEQMLQRNFLARQRALQQQQQQQQQQAQQADQQSQALRAQNVGLQAPNVFTQPPAGSPAMSMLNRPMQPPGGQQKPGQQQQNRPNSAMQDANGINMLQQHHQNMLNQNSLNPAQTVGRQNAQPALSAMLDSIDPALRNKILALPPQERINALSRLKQLHEQKQQTILAPAAAINNGVPNATALALQQADGMSQQQQQQPQPPQQNMNGMQQNADLAAQQRHKQQTFRFHAMLSRPLPRHIASQLQIAIPPHIQQWAHLRTHIMQNRNIFPSDMPVRMMKAMEAHFNQNPNELQQGVQELLSKHQAQAQQMRGSVPNGVPNMNGSQSMNNFMGNTGQNVPPQMNAPTANMQDAQSNMATDALQKNLLSMIPNQINAQDIARFRIEHKIGPEVPEEAIRSAMVHQRMRMLQQHQAQARQQHLQQQQQNNQAALKLGGTQPNGLNLNLNLNRGQQNNGQTQMGPNMTGAAQSKSQVPNMRPDTSSTNDDVMEIPNPLGFQNNKQTPGAPGMQRNISQQQSRRPTPEQISKLPKEQQARLQQQMAALRNAQSKPGNATARPGNAETAPAGATDARSQTIEDARALLARLHRDMGPLPAKGPIVPAEAHELAELKGFFKRMWKPLQVLDSTFISAFKNIPGFTDQRAQMLIRGKATLMQNVQDEHGNIRDYLSTPFQELKQIGETIMRYYAELQKASPNKRMQQTPQMAQNGAQQRERAPSTVQQPLAAPPMAPTQSQQGHVRKQSSSSKAPSAPVDEKRFQFPPPNSPAGVPKYGSKQTELTPDNLKLPPNKKRKTGPNGSQPSTPTPAQQATTVPPAAKAAVRPPSKMAEPEKPTFRCPKSDLCEANLQGFETEAQLKEHIESAHKPVEDPLAFLLDNAASALGLDENGNPLPTKGTGKAGNKAPPAKANAKDVVGKKSVEAEQAHDTLLQDVLADKAGYKQDDVVPAQSMDTMDDSSFWAELSAPIESTLHDLDPFETGMLDDVDDWGLDLTALPSLTSELTPESSASNNSDISLADQLKINLEWDPFGVGDTYVPDLMELDGLGLEDGVMKRTSSVDDSTSEKKPKDDDKGSSAEDKKEGKDAFEWSDDLVMWDAFIQ